MAGAYCRYCNHRCFVERVLPAGHRCSGVCVRLSHRLHLATCAAGAAHDRDTTGFDFKTASNPVEPLAAWLAGDR